MDGPSPARAARKGRGRRPGRNPGGTARCGQDITAIQGAWFPACGFWICALETPPTIGDRPGLVRPAVPPGAVVAFVALLVIGALAWGVGAFWWVDDTTIHEPTVPPTGAPGHSSHEVGIEPRDLVYVVHGHTGTVPVILFREVFEAQPNRLVGYAGDGATERFRRTVRSVPDCRTSKTLRRRSHPWPMTPTIKPGSQ